MSWKSVIRLPAAVAAVTLAIQVVPAPAFAHGKPFRAGSVESSTISSSELVDHRDDRATADERTKAEKQLLEQSADNGVLYDESEVDSAVVGDTAVAWNDSVDVENVVVSTSEDSNGEKTVEGLGIEASNGPDAADLAVAEMGSQELVGPTGQWGDVSGGTVQVTNNGFKIISGWQRYRIRESKIDREVYYYGHWISAFGKSRTTYDQSPMILDIRSRPKTGLRSTFLQLRNYWPKSEDPSCNSQGDISVSALGFGGSLPLQNCSSLAPDPDSNSITMKVVWSAGVCKDQRVEGADLGMAVDTRPGKVAVLSDYSYARFSNADAPCDTNASNDTRVIYADPGW